MKDRLRQAEAFVAEHAPLVNPAYRPRFHMAAPCGWLNDPNGFSFYRGQYHLFYQYAPYASHPGRMYWGHCVSDDLVCWRYVGIAIAPDTEADSDQCWSGNAIEDGEGRLVAMYTALRPDGKGRRFQEQCIAVSRDGIHFEKPACNPVISGKDLPPDGSVYDFRDPKLVRAADGWWAVVANRGEHGGRQLLYRSDDLTHWTYRGVFLEGIGQMPECPDLFTLGGRDVMITSVMGLPKDGLRFQSHVSDVVYLIGRIEGERFVPACMEAVDLGPDFYAPQSIDTPDGRHVMIGWMQMWREESPTDYLGHGWNGAMTIPRELSIQNGRLYQLPVRELNAYRHNHRAWQDVDIRGETALDGLSGRRYELSAALTLPRGGKAELRLLKTGDEYFRIHYDAATHILTTDRSRCGYSMSRDNLWEEKPGGRAVVPDGGETLRLTVLVDSDSVEVFVNDGVLAMTTLAFPKGPAEGIAFAGAGHIDRLDIWDLA